MWLGAMQELFWGECLLLVPACDSVSKETLQIRSPSKLYTRQNSSLQVFLSPRSKASALVLFCVFTSQHLSPGLSSWEMSPRPYLSSKYFSLVQSLQQPPFLPPDGSETHHTLLSTELSRSAGWARTALIDWIKQVRNKSKTNSNHSDLPQTQ